MTARVLACSSALLLAAVSLGATNLAEIRVTPVVLYITGLGPTDTVYVKQSDAPR